MKNNITSRIPTLDLISKKGRRVTLKSDEKPFARNHFKIRWKIRMGYICIDSRYDEIRHTLKTTGRLLDRQPNGRHKYLVRYEGMNLKIIFDPKLNEMVTLLER